MVIYLSVLIWRLLDGTYDVLDDDSLGRVCLLTR